ncbi:MAG: LptE family protein [Kiritimatiellaeota bacterium]|nr:LptE family protein [Kiritimatiellota bacterium]
MSKPIKIPSVLLALLLPALGLLTQPGCTGYRLGSMLPPDIKTVGIPTFVNRTSEPQIEIQATRSALEEIQRDGSLRIAPENQADAILQVKLTDYRIVPLVYDAQRKTAASQYRLTLYAAIILTRRSDNKVIVEHPRCYGEATFPVIGDMSSSKRIGLPKAAADLAHDIVQKVTEVWTEEKK